MARCILGLVMVVAVCRSVPSRAETEGRLSSKVAETAALAFVPQGTIVPSAEAGAILGMAVAPEGGLVAVTGASERFGAGTVRGRTKTPPAHRLVWFAADGTEERAVPLDFAATTIAAAPDGSLYVAGDGVVFRVSSRGDPMNRAATPAGPQSPEERAEFERLVGERHESQVAALEKQVQRMRAADGEAKQRLAKAEAFIVAEQEAARADEQAAEAGKADDAGTEDADDDDAEERRRRRESRIRVARSQASRIRTELRQMASKLKEMEQPLENLRKREVRDIVEASLAKARQVRSISAARDAAFIVVPEASGYGYSLWRFDERLENPTKIVSQLVGCCGQMDVQVFGDRLAIASNRKHCVDLVDFAGEAIGSFGQRATGRAGEAKGSFGGCCNPMNTCIAPGGSLLTSESDGTVKRFESDGTFVEVVGKAKVRAGCKNSAIAIEPDGSRLYYLDVERGSVIVLAPTRGDGDEESGPSSDAESKS